MGDSIQSSTKDNEAVTKVSREGLISVPLATRPNSKEIPSYLTAFQARIIEVSLQLANDSSILNTNADTRNVGDTLRRLVTTMSTEIEYIRIPIVWAAINKLTHTRSALSDFLVDEKISVFDELIETSAIFLSHFDLARHLSEAEKRVANGDDQIDEALFIALEQSVTEFDMSRAQVFADTVERAGRIGAVFSLPSGNLPKFTVAAYKFYSAIASWSEFVARRSFALGGFVLAIQVLVALSGNSLGDLANVLIEYLGAAHD